MLIFILFDTCNIVCEMEINVVELKKIELNSGYKNGFSQINLIFFFFRQRKES